MKSPQDNFKKARDLLIMLFGDVGDPVRPTKDEMEEIKKKYEDPLVDNTFHLIFDVRPNSIPMKWVNRKHLKRLLGYDDLTYEKWISIIHPSFLGIYLEFGLAAYRVSKENPEFLTENKTSYSIALPVRHGVTGKYWMVNQNSSPLEFDKNGRMVSHLNAYQVIERFHRYSPMRPLVRFDSKSQKKIETEILSQTRKNMLEIFYPGLKKKYKRVLLAYWKLYTDFMESDGEKPTAQSVSDVLEGVQKLTVHKYSQDIIKLSNHALNIMVFSDILSVVEFLYGLFGPISSFDLE